MTTQNTNSPLTAVEQDIRDAAEVATLEQRHREPDDAPQGREGPHR